MVRVVWAPSDDTILDPGGGVRLPNAPLHTDGALWRPQNHNYVMNSKPGGSQYT